MCRGDDFVHGEGLEEPCSHLTLTRSAVKRGNDGTFHHSRARCRRVEQTRVPKRSWGLSAVEQIEDAGQYVSHDAVSKVLAHHTFALALKVKLGHGAWHLNCALFP
mmetsp:Transcript_15154/g.54562  ORF Transcript_15154/g.54562 Transcript_15154/m.54562 type:complete len:106 (-) Transcript_15154:117-434(-)